MQTDGDLVRASLRSPHEFGALFDRHFDVVHGFAQRRVGSDLAAEIAAETFATAFARRRSYDISRPDARPWLLGIASNLLRRHWRTERRRIAAYSRALEPSHAPVSHVSDEVVVALSSLSKDERETLFLYALADLAYDEIASALGCPVGTVRSRLARARGRLRAELRATNPRELEESVHV